MPDAPQPKDQFQTSRKPAPFAPLLDRVELADLSQRIKSDNTLRHFALGGVILLGVVLILGLAVAAPFGLGAGAGSLWLLLVVFYIWMLFAFLHYRHGRQDELRQLLIATIEAEAPLPQALRAYLRDRPQGLARQFWAGVLLWFVYPGYYWIWYIWNNFDRKVTQLSFLLEQGVPLPRALLLTPGVAPPETILAATVGEATGQVGRCLKEVDRPVAKVWYGVGPLWLYPLGLLLVLSFVMTFWNVFIAPKMEKIYKDFDVRLPWLTEAVIQFCRAFSPTILAPLAAVNVLLLLPQLFSSTVCWYFPVLGWVYRRNWQGQVLRLLGALLEPGLPAVTAVQLLSQAGAAPAVVRHRLDAVAEELEEGHELALSLARHSLLPTALAPLVQAAERSQHLPQTLVELGDRLTQRAARFLHRFGQVTALGMVLLMGGLTALAAIGMFLPLVKLLESLS